MRNTAVFVVFVTSTLAGCFSPKIADGGFQCDPSDPAPCPEGYFCRNVSGANLCTTSSASTTGGGDMATSGGGGGGGGGGGSGGGGGGGGTADLAMPVGAPDMAMPPPDMTTPPNNCTASSLLINEVQSGPGYDEFIEIFNPCSNTIMLTGKLVYRFDTASSDGNTLATISNKSIAAQGFLLVANTGFTGTATPDYTYTNIGMADGGGGVGLRDGANALLASMGWGTANNGFQHGSAAPTEATGKSIARKPNGATSNNDSVDFKSSTPTPGAAN